MTRLIVMDEATALIKVAHLASVASAATVTPLISPSEGVIAQKIKVFFYLFIYFLAQAKTCFAVEVKKH